MVQCIILSTWRGWNGEGRNGRWDQRLRLWCLRNVLFSPRCNCYPAPVQGNCSGRVMWGIEGQAGLLTGPHVACMDMTFTITMDRLFLFTDTLSTVPSRTGHTHNLDQHCASLKCRFNCFLKVLAKGQSIESCFLHSVLQTGGLTFGVTQIFSLQIPQW